MNNILKFITAGIVALIIGYFVYFFYGIFKYSHSVDWEMDKEYMWIFKDSVKHDINNDFAFSYVNQEDVYNNYHYKDFNIIVWEFKNVYQSKNKDQSINRNVNLDDLQFKSGEVLNSKSEIEITIEYGFTFSNMDINIDEYSIIEKSFDSLNYKGFYGAINKMSLSNELGKHQILFNYTIGKEPTMLLLYKKSNNLYIIIINSKKPFDTNMINIFNLT